MATGDSSGEKNEMKAVPQRCLGNRPNETNERPFEKGKTKHTLILYINYCVANALENKTLINCISALLLMLTYHSHSVACH